jgi:polyphenol oxidase
MHVLTASNLFASPRVRHGFFGRRGGISEGVYATLNCGPGSGDERERVVENRRRVLETVAQGEDATLVTLYQIHSPNAVIVETPWEIGEAPEADAMATNAPGIALGILTADCAPVLLADGKAGVIGAAHAGWKGAQVGVIEGVVGAMEKLGADRSAIHAAIGPTISQANYEVGPEFYAGFVTSDSRNSRFFVPSRRTDHWQFDLESYVASRLIEAGIADVERLAACTYAREADFFSFRRTTHRAETDYGRDISAIMLTA